MHRKVESACLVVVGMSPENAQQLAGTVIVRGEPLHVSGAGKSRWVASRPAACDCWLGTLAMLGGRGEMHGYVRDA